MSVCRKNLQYAQKLQKYYYNNHTKSKSYDLGDKVWLISKYIKTKQNRKLEFKFFRPFRIMQLVRNQAYKLELSKRWSIYDIFYVSCWNRIPVERGG